MHGEGMRELGAVFTAALDTPIPEAIAPKRFSGKFMVPCPT